MEKLESIKNINFSETKSLCRLADLYNAGIKDKEIQTYSRLFSGLTITLSIISAICLGIMACYLIYIYC